MLHGVTKVLKGSLLFLIYRLLKLTLKIIPPIQGIRSNGITFLDKLGYCIKSLSLYFPLRVDRKGES